MAIEINLSNLSHINMSHQLYLQISKLASDFDDEITNEWGDMLSEPKTERSGYKPEEAPITQRSPGVTEKESFDEPLEKAIKRMMWVKNLIPRLADQMKNFDPNTLMTLEHIKYNIKLAEDLYQEALYM